MAGELERRVSGVEKDNALTKQAISIMGKAQDDFRGIVADHMAKEELDRGDIYREMNRMRSAVDKMPGAVSVQITNCQRDLKRNIANDHPKHHEVVSPKAMVVVITLTLTAMTLIFGATSWFINTYTVPAWQVTEQQKQPQETRK